MNSDMHKNQTYDEPSKHFENKKKNEKNIII